MKKISRTKIMQLLGDSKGYYVGIDWISKYNKFKSINCKVPKGAPLTRLGNLRVKDSKGNYKTIIPKNIKKARINKMEYSV